MIDIGYRCNRIRSIKSVALGHAGNSMTIGETLKAVRRKRGLTQPEFATVCQANRVTVSRRETGARGLSDEELQSIAGKLGVTLAVSANGWHFVDQPDPLAVDPNRDLDPPPGTIKLPIEATAGAGPAMIADGVEEEWVDLAANFYRRVDKLLRIGGDSMEPMLSKGDIVGVKLCTERACRDGDVVVARYPDHGAILVKVYRGRFDDFIKLQSLNPVHEVILEPATELEIRGRIMRPFGEDFLHVA